MSASNPLAPEQRCEHTTKRGKRCLLPLQHPRGHDYPPEVRSEHYWRNGGELVRFTDVLPTLGQHVKVSIHLTYPKGREQWREASGVYMGVRTDEWDDRREVHFFQGGRIGETKQACWAFPTYGTEPDPTTDKDVTP